MNHNKYENLSKAKKALLKSGYIHQFILKNGFLINVKNQQKYAPEELEIVEYHRFKNKTKKGQTVLILAVACRDKTRGIIISTYENYADMQLVKFMSKAKIQSRAVPTATS